jgi:hypothetical protein
MYAAHGGHQGVRTQRREFSEGISSTGQGLNPSQTGRALEQSVIKLKMVTNDYFGTSRMLQCDASIVGRKQRDAGKVCARTLCEGAGIGLGRPNVEDGRIQAYTVNCFERVRQWRLLMNALC